MAFEVLLSKQGRIVISLGCDLIGRDVGERLPTVQEYARRYSTSVGTVQNAQSFLQQQSLVKLQPRGHQGTFLSEIDRRSLWKLVHPGDMVGAMPLPYSPRYEGLATAFYQAFEQAEIPLNLVFMRGSAARLKALAEERCDFAIMSAFALAEAEDSERAFVSALNLGRESYVGEHVLLFHQPGMQQIQNGMRVGIDSQSVDQAHLTQQACAGKQVTFVEIGYMQLAAALQKDVIDATVWNSDELRRYPELHTAPLPAALNSHNTEACVITLNESTHLIALLNECLNVDIIRQIQTEVMNGSRLPRY
jgi:hypothetical protein